MGTEFIEGLGVSAGRARTNFQSGRPIAIEETNRVWMPGIQTLFSFSDALIWARRGLM
jgi:hypothetical protein